MCSVSCTGKEFSRWVKWSSQEVREILVTGAIDVNMVTRMMDRVCAGACVSPELPAAH